jgi:hypothetical protein
VGVAGCAARTGTMGTSVNAATKVTQRAIGGIAKLFIWQG